MATQRRRLLFRNLFFVALVLGIMGGSVYAFWPKPIAVETQVLERGPMVISFDEQGRTQVREIFTVTAPHAGRLTRVTVETGDVVVKDETVIARLLPNPPAAMDARSREQAEAGVRAARAGLGMAEAELEGRMEAQKAAQADLDRMQKLLESDTVSPAFFDQVATRFTAAQLAVETAAAAIALREAELDRAIALTMTAEETTGASADPGLIENIYAPADGIVLRLFETSETTVMPGSPIMEVGDPQEGLEVVAEFLTTQAVQIKVGMPARVDNWGGGFALTGEVKHIEPWAVERISALGVQEQRVAVVIDLTVPVPEGYQLGHGYRADVKVLLWQDAEALWVPPGALFAHETGFAVFVRDDESRARLVPVTLGRRNGFQAEVLSGLEAGDSVVLFPPDDLSNGALVQERGEAITNI
ncbi:MAG: efflux RND transporter periplasmic adaptor subunit [Alphaproteobacteria bacterium]